jgi:hypothetical protein
LKIGLFVVTVSYFFFTLHAMFTLSWIGEWEALVGPARFWIFITDITATVGLVFRLIASFTAFAVMILYFAKKGLSTPNTIKILRLILVAEAIYWLPLVVSGIWGVLPVDLGGFGNDGSTGLQFNLWLLMTTGLPCLVSGIGIPAALFKLAFEMNPNKPQRVAIKWGLIAGTIYVLVFWLNNTGMWISTVQSKGTEYLISNPENLLSFASTTIGLLTLTIFVAYFSKKSIGAESLEKLNMKTLGAIVTALGLYFFWNYLSWVLFDSPWSSWYAWFLGHNLDLWILSIPLVGLPLLFEQKVSLTSERQL